MVDVGVVFMSMRVVMPRVMRERVLQRLHQAHQGVSGMEAWAWNTVWWPYMMVDLERTRNACHNFTFNAPSQKKTPSTGIRSPDNPMQMVVAD